MVRRRLLLAVLLLQGKSLVFTLFLPSFAQHLFNYRVSLCAKGFFLLFLSDFHKFETQDAGLLGLRFLVSFRLKIHFHDLLVLALLSTLLWVFAFTGFLIVVLAVRIELLVYLGSGLSSVEILGAVAVAALFVFAHFLFAMGKRLLFQDRLMKGVASLFVVHSAETLQIFGVLVLRSVSHS